MDMDATAYFYGRSINGDVDYHIDLFSYSAAGPSILKRYDVAQDIPKAVLKTLSKLFSSFSRT